MTCAPGRCCSSAHWCGGGPAWCASDIPQYSNGNCFGATGEPFAPSPAPAPPPPPAPALPCEGCHFDVRALEDFSVTYAVKEWAGNPSDFTTSPVPDTLPTETGTIALNARNLQLKLDSHATFAPNAHLGPMPVGRMTIHEELHINGATGQASFHLASPILNLCFQVDHLPPVAQMERGNINMHLEQAEHMAPQVVQRFGHRGSVDGVHDVVLTGPPGHAIAFTEDTHPLFMTTPLSFREKMFYQRLLHPSPSMESLDRVGVKFTSYTASVGHQFSVRACEIATATQTMLESNPEVRHFVATRISHHQANLGMLLEPMGLNTKYNFIPLGIADLMVPPPQNSTCTGEEMAQIELAQLSTSWSTGQVSSVCAGSIVLGIAASFVALRKKRSTAEDYQQVVA